MTWDPLQTALSDDDEPHLSWPPSPIVYMGMVNEPEVVDIDEKRVAEDSASSQRFRG